MSKEIINSLWIITGKISSILGSIIFFSILSKNITQIAYAEYNLAIIIFSTTLVICQLGINQCLTKLYNNINTNNKSLIYSCFKFQLLSSSASLVFLLFYSWNTIYSILFLSILFKPIDLYRVAFDSELKSYVYQRLDIISSIFFSIIKIILGSNGDLFFICVTFLLESITQALIAIVISKQLTWNNSRNIMPISSILKESIPVFIPAILYIIYSRTDQIVIYKTLPLTEQAKYFSALQLSEGFGFLTAAITISYFSSMTKAKDKIEYVKYLTEASLAISRITIPIAILISLFGEQLLKYVFTEKYSDAHLCLSTLSWCLVILGHSSITVKHLIIIGKQKLSIYRAIIGIIINTPMTIYLTPKYGIFGAAISTLTAQFIALFLSNLFRNETRFLFYIQLKSLFMLR